MNKELSKAIMGKSKTRNKYLKWPKSLKTLTKKAKKIFLRKLQKTGLCLIKRFQVLSNIFQLIKAVSQMTL